MKQLISLFLLVVVIASCSIERRHYLPGLHVEWQVASGERRVTTDKGLVTSDKGRVTNVANGGAYLAEVMPILEPVNEIVADNSNEFSYTPALSSFTKESISKSSTAHSQISHSSLVIRHSLSPDTLKKPFKPQQQYREVDPVGKASVIVVLAGVALQKLAGMLTWFEVVVPLTFGPAIFIPALIVAVIGVGLSAYSAYRVRKYPEKYKKNEWGKAALAILGWQILMTVLFAWLLV